MWEHPLRLNHAICGCIVLALASCSDSKKSPSAPSTAGDASSEPDARVLPRSDTDAATICADIHLGANPVTPTVMLIVDRSGSMTADFGSGDRWSVLKDSLLADPDGLLYDLQSNVRFGLTMYSAQDNNDDGHPDEGTTCPALTSVAPAINNFDAIEAAYAPADVIDETPTGDAIDAILASLNVDAADGDPVVFIVATDGEPDSCEETNPQTGQEEAVSAVVRARNAGVRTYMISVGDEVSEEHLQDMANAGVGATGGENAPFWVAGDDAGLRDALQTIIGGTLTCEINLEGTLDPEMACEGTVTLNGNALPCNDPNGWQVVDSDTIRLQGTACEMATRGPAILDAAFPCEVVLY